MQSAPDPRDDDGSPNGDDPPDVDSENPNTVDTLVDSDTASDIENAANPRNAADSTNVVDPPEEIDHDAVQRLEPRIRLLWMAQVGVLSVVLGGVALAVAVSIDAVPMWMPGAIAGSVALVGGVFVILRFRRWRFELREDALYLERGVITRVRTVVPYVRIQHVDASRGPIERATGLARSVVYTAGSRGADVTIPGLTPARADDLQERLKRLAVATGGDDGV